LYGIGIIECRILAVLAWKPDMTANEICAVLDIDKAAVSRSLRVLQTRDFVTLARNATRRRTICLTEKGADLHAKAMVIGQRREQALLKGFSTAERAQLMGFLHRLLDNAAEMNAQEFSSDMDETVQETVHRNETVGKLSVVGKLPIS
jgi:DNA-binding MarR family transcriptional regulator